MKNAPLPVWVVCVREVDQPAGVEPLEWILLTNCKVATLEDAWERTSWYECRWIIEEYHKAQKTGCSIEDLQFTSAGANATNDRVAIGDSSQFVEPARREPSTRCQRAKGNRADQCAILSCSLRLAAQKSQHKY